MPPSIANGLVILNSTPNVPTFSLASISEDVYTFLTCRFFEYVGKEHSPLIRVLSASSIGSIAKESKPVRSALTALGAAFASRDEHNFSADARSEFTTIAKRAYKETSNYMQSTGNQGLLSANHLFLCALLKSIFEVCGDVIIFPSLCQVLSD